MTAATGMNNRRPVGYSSSTLVLRTSSFLVGWSVSLPVMEGVFFSAISVAC